MADSTPTLAGFQTYCYGPPGMTTAIIPENDPGFSVAYYIALEWIPLVLNKISGYLYTYTVYQWGVSVLLTMQQDQPGQTFFADMRSAYGVNNFVPGVISQTSDETTSTGLTVGDSLSNLSMVDLQRCKDPFGRAAMETLMSIGPLWGLS